MRCYGALLLATYLKNKVSTSVNLLKLAQFFDLEQNYFLLFSNFALQIYPLSSFYNNIFLVYLNLKSTLFSLLLTLYLPARNKQPFSSCTSTLFSLHLFSMTTFNFCYFNFIWTIFVFHLQFFCMYLM